MCAFACLIQIQIELESGNREAGRERERERGGKDERQRETEEGKTSKIFLTAVFAVCWGETQWGGGGLASWQQRPD